MKYGIWIVVSVRYPLSDIRQDQRPIPILDRSGPISTTNAIGTAAGVDVSESLRPGVRFPPMQ